MSQRRLFLLRAITVGLAVIVLAACPKKAATPAGELDLNGAAQFVAKDLAQQVTLRADDRTLVIDPLLDRATGQQTGASAKVETAVGPALSAAIRGLTLIPFEGDSVGKARLVLTGTVSNVEPPDRYSVTVALADRQTGLVVAQSAARFREGGLDNTPTKFYNDSPSLVRDRSVDGYVRTAETPAGKPADALYIEQVPTAALLAEALDAYNAERWDEALTAYTAAAARPDGQQLRTFNGLYLTNTRLKRVSAAEEAFGRIAALGLATNNLAVKLLFRAGSATEFFPTPDLSGNYPMWIRQIARAAQKTRACLEIVGHTSKSGPEALNDKLSVSRAETVKRMLEAEVRTLGAQLRASGVGFTQNLIGTGADDATDAVDRRVEFKVVSCGSSTRGR
jgi:outer membrane protein OmpA-like peptidoglycan-associated protein